MLLRKKSTATHEAGHFVMRWYLGMSPTGCAVFSSVRTANGGPATGLSKAAKDALATVAKGLDGE